METRLNRYLAVSFGAHGAVLFLFLVQKIIFPNSPLLFQPTVQVDLVALPNQVKAPEQMVDTSLPVTDQVPPETAPEPDVPNEPEAMVKETEKPKNPSKSPEAIKKDANKALEKLKQEIEKQKLDARQKLIEAEKERIQSLEQRSRQALRGNQVNQGTSASGALEQTINAYGGHVTEILRSHWALPTWLQSRNLSASVRIYIDQQGRIMSYKFTQSSGNEAFDNEVKRAVEQSSRLAPPPAEMARQLQTNGIEVGFPL
jgi:colicin import membrane protein